MAHWRALKPGLPILLGASAMLTLSMGIRQTFGLFLQPITQGIALSVSDFTLALSIQNLVWGLLQPVAGALVVRLASDPSSLLAPCSTCWASPCSLPPTDSWACCWARA
jgi:hypothetical protein